MSSSFPGVAFITGAGSGIGSAVAHALVERGCTRLALVDISSEGLAKTAASITSTKHAAQTLSIELITCDIRLPSSIDAAIAQAVRTFGTLHYCVNSAGVMPEKAASLDVSVESWKEVLLTNQRGTWLSMRSELRQLLAQLTEQPSSSTERGSIVNITSSHALGAQPGFPASGASSHGIVGMTRTVAMDYCASGVRVNAVCAGPTATLGLAACGRETEEALLDVTPIGRLITVEEIASAVVWLLGARAVTGLALPVDGGWGLCHY